MNTESNTHSTLWAVHSQLKSWTLYSLTTEQVVPLLLSLNFNELKLIKVSKKNEPQWQILDKQNHPELFAEADLYKKNNGFPDIGAEATHNAETDTSYFIVKSAKTIQPRLHKRYEVAVSCSISGISDKLFETKTRDLSEGGLFFTDIIPSWVAGYFLVTVNDKFKLMCCLVEDQKEKCRVQIVSEESDLNFLKYKEWITTL